MKALQQIIRRVAENPSRPWALATLVQTEGSTYRKPGARLLVERNGKTLGVLSGGCLEEEIARHGQKVIDELSPVLLSFDTKLLYGCDGQLKILVEPIPAAGPNGNLITAIGRALKSRDNGCRFPGCTHQRYVDAHHVQHWVHGGETKLGNLVTLCRFHHRYVHEENITVQNPPDGSWRFLKPDGSVFEDVRPTQTPDYAWTDLLDAHDEQAIYIDSETAATRWRGERMDYGLAIQGLLQRSDPARYADPAQNSDGGQDPEGEQNVSAETCECGQAIGHNAEWHRHDEEGTFFYMTWSRGFL